MKMEIIEQVYNMPITEEEFFAGEPFRLEITSNYYLRFKGTREDGYIQSGWRNHFTDSFTWESHYCNVDVTKIVAYHSIFSVMVEITLKFKKYKHDNEKSI